MRIATSVHWRKVLVNKLRDTHKTQHSPTQCRAVLVYESFGGLQIKLWANNAEEQVCQK